MEPLKIHHHYKKDLIEVGDRVARCERYVIDLLLNSPLSDEQRESSIAFELKHHSGVTQFARVLARKRGLPIDVCSVGALFHDLFVIVNGKYKDHAHLSALLAKRALEEIGGFTDDEMSQIWQIIYYHSDKQVWSDDPFQEIGKDADILDCFLIPNPLPQYLLTKPLSILYHYLKRAKNVWQELGIPEDPGFDILSNYSSSWFDTSKSFAKESIEILLAILVELSQFEKKYRLYSPPFCITSDNNQFVFFTNRKSWLDYIKNLKSKNTASFFSITDSLLASLKILIIEGSTLNRVPKYLIETNKNLLSDEKLSRAAQFLNDIFEQRGAIIFWPAVDGYEFLQNEQMITRLKEFGVIYPES